MFSIAFPGSTPLVGHNNLACALVMLGLSSQPMNTQLVQQGLQAAEQAITLAPHVPLYWRNAAVLLALTGDQSEPWTFK